MEMSTSIRIPDNLCKQISELDGRLNIIKFQEHYLPIYYIYNINKKSAEALSEALYRAGLWCKALEARVVLCYPLHICVLLENCLTEIPHKDIVKYMVLTVKRCMRSWNLMTALWLSDPLGELLKFLKKVPHWLWNIEKDCLMDMLKRPDKYLDLMDLEDFLDFLSKLYKVSGSVVEDEKGEKMIRIVVRSPQPFTHKIIDKILHKIASLGLLEEVPYVGDLWRDEESAYHIEVRGKTYVEKFIDMVS